MQGKEQWEMVSCSGLSAVILSVTGLAENPRVKSFRNLVIKSFAAVELEA
jgi:hypothetical protein